MSKFELKVGGPKATYAGGGQKEDSSQIEGKGAYHLIPTIPIRRIAEIYRKGALKYAPYNWTKGIPLSCFVDSAKRHLDQFVEGLIDEDHAAQAGWHILGLIHTQEMIKRGILPPSLDDLPSYGPPGDPNYRPSGPGVWLPKEQKGLWPEEIEALNKKDK